MKNTSTTYFTDTTFICNKLGQFFEKIMIEKKNHNLKHQNLKNLSKAIELTELIIKTPKIKKIKLLNYLKRV